MSLGGVKEFKNVLDSETEYHDSANGWTHTNKLLVSKPKTKNLVIFSPNLQHDLLPGPIDNNEQVNTLKFLGVILSSNYSVILNIFKIKF